MVISVYVYVSINNPKITIRSTEDNENRVVISNNADNKMKGNKR